MVLSAVAALGITVSLSSYHRVTVADRARSVRSPVGPTGVWACRHRRHRLRGRGPRCRWRSVRYATTRRWHDDGAGEQSKGPSAGDAGGPEDAWRTGGDRRHPSAGRQWRNNERRATVITSNRDFNEWPLVFANPLMASATMDRLVHRAVKIVIKGKSCRSPRRTRNKAESVRSTGVSSIPPRPAEGPYRPSWRNFSPGTGPKCAPKLAHRAISPFLAVRHSLVSPKSAALRSQHRPTSPRTPRRSGRRRFKSCAARHPPGRLRRRQLPRQAPRTARPGWLLTRYRLRPARFQPVRAGHVQVHRRLAAPARHGPEPASVSPPAAANCCSPACCGMRCSPGRRCWHSCCARRRT